jgi:malate synthase
MCFAHLVLVLPTHKTMTSTLLESPLATSGNTESVADVLTPDALQFMTMLVRRFGPRRENLLAARQARLARVGRGEEHLGFLDTTAHMRDSEWRVPQAPHDLTRRTVEITAPAERKMMINALNSGADVFMCDLEDAYSPTWHNVIEGQRNLAEAVRGTLSFDDATTGKSYRLGPTRSTLVVRPRGLHLIERHLVIDDEPAPASLVDFALYFFHNAHALLQRNSAPYFYLPKLESHHEARWWNDVFRAAQYALKIPQGSIRATVLIETLPAAFEMDEILYELREHASGLNCGRWDYIFSFIKTQQFDPNALLPDRAAVTMTQPNMRAYTQLAVRTCHRRGAYAIGGMAAQIPVRDNPEANEKAMAGVSNDKKREVNDGHDGTWVAHPALVPIARAAFADVMRGDNQLDRTRDDVHVTASDLLQVPTGPRTESGLRLNVRVGIRYLTAWLGGAGAVPLYNLMEDVATAEISRAQVWQWIQHGARLDDGRTVTEKLVTQTINEEMDVIANEVGAMEFRQGRYAEARTLFESLCTSRALADFLTVRAYDKLEYDTRVAFRNVFVSAHTSATPSNSIPANRVEASL